MQYESLMNEIHDKGVEVIHMRFSGNLKGLYADSTIAIDTKIETEAERCCVLAEEIGHHYTSLGTITNLEDIRNLKQEKRARNWAYEKLVGLVGLINAFNSGARDRFELAAYLDVTEEFLDEALKHYKERYGMYYEIDNYLIYFEPFGILKMI
jgi:hypothetical protein